MPGAQRVAGEHEAQLAGAQDADRERIERTAVDGLRLLLHQLLLHRVAPRSRPAGCNGRARERIPRLPSTRA
ncbi:hypothetical protein GCM10022266_04190 [Agrococcus terreus]